MKYLVTGGAGFIGSHLVDELILLGHTVVCIDNESGIANKYFYWNPKAENYKLDIKNYNEIEYLFKDIDCVFHLASDSRIQYAIENPRKSLDVNVIGTINVLDACKKYNIKRIIFSSTSSIYGIENNIPNNENDLGDPLSIYSASKIFAEHLLKIYYSLYNIETISLRYFNVYGERQPDFGKYATVIGLFQKQKESNEPLTVVGDGSQKRDFTYVKDIVKANILAATSLIPHNYIGTPFNVGTGKNYSIKEIAEMFGGNIKYIDKRKSEANETLADNNKFYSVFEWKPEFNLENWIKSI